MEIKGTHFTIPNYRSTIYTCVIDEDNINNTIVEVINSCGDTQNHTSNIKADMTDWKMMNKPGFKELSDIVLKMVTFIVGTKYNYSIANFFKIYNMWGVKYKSNDFAIVHDHWPATFSFVYYINPPTNCPSLLFKDYDISIQPEHGLIVVFDGNLSHEVKQQNFDGFRYVVAGNINYIESVN